MTAKEAVIKVLNTEAKPLHTKVITDMIITRGLWQTSGKAPAATIEARISTDIKHNGNSSPFIRVAPSTYGLRDLEAVPVTIVKKTKPQKAKVKTLSFTNAAEKVLSQFGDKKPMHYRDVTDKALELNLLNTEGKTPEATMYAQILTEINRSKKRGKQPRFVQHGKGYVSLSQWMGRGLVFEIEKHNLEVSKKLHKQLFALKPAEFEELIARLLAEIGFEEIEVTKRSNDGGIDVRGLLVVGEVIKTRMAVQAKRWKKGNNIQKPTVQQVRGSLGTHEQGLIITTSDFSLGAKQEALRPDAVPVALMNGEELVALLTEHEIGITLQTHNLLDLSGNKLL
ncbi:MAG: restriction endonuclease [Desulfobacterales bacterium]|nr:restriction endonuclease [Desulfobacterales bacterium]